MISNYKAFTLEHNIEHSKAPLSQRVLAQANVFLFKYFLIPNLNPRVIRVQFIDNNKH